VQDGHTAYQNLPCYEYMKKMSELNEGYLPLPALFQGIHPEIVAVLKAMLNLDPSLRITARDLLKNKIFD
jgi:hypothetical protein